MEIDWKPKSSSPQMGKMDIQSLLSLQGLPIATHLFEDEHTERPIFPGEIVYPLLLEDVARGLFVTDIPSLHQLADSDAKVWDASKGLCSPLRSAPRLSKHIGW
ncbi:hypothetical protein ACJ73_08266 [Blastomyces percursus]|uniref:Uncharacterized protein n=1 Tax=Blastomyces percursus TaxID=1658174 RepID=A0A1J9PVL1_9EURO|nr:hypothetical protein ACJ73_08266 [Blastomyces percursus]